MLRSILRQSRFSARLLPNTEAEEELKAKTAEAGEHAKAEFQELLQDMQEKQEAAQKKLEELRAASAEAWEKMKVALDAAMEEVQKSYEKFRARWSDKESA